MWGCTPVLQISLGYTANFRLVWVQNEMSRKKRKWKGRRGEGRGGKKGGIEREG